MNLNLKYRRQYVAGFEESDRFHNWQHIEFQKECLHIYAHPNLEMTSAKSRDDIKLVLLGIAIDPKHPKRSNQDIANELTNASVDSVERFSDFITNLAGRFVIILSRSSQIYVFNDACGLRSVYYADVDGKKFITSQPLLFSEFFYLKPRDRYYKFCESSYKLNSPEYWLPSGLTLYENVWQLMPNHYLDL